MAVTSAISAPAVRIVSSNQLIRMELHNLRRILAVVAEAYPGRPNPHVDQNRPAETTRTIGERVVIHRFQTLQFETGRFVGNALELHRPLVTVVGAADDECHPGIS